MWMRAVVARVSQGGHHHDIPPKRRCACVRVFCLGGSEKIPGWGIFQGFHTLDMHGFLPFHTFPSSSEIQNPDGIVVLYVPVQFRYTNLERREYVPSIVFLSFDLRTDYFGIFRSSASSKEAEGVDRFD